MLLPERVNEEFTNILILKTPVLIIIEFSNMISPSLVKDSVKEDDLDGVRPGGDGTAGGEGQISN